MAGTLGGHGAKRLRDHFGLPKLRQMLVKWIARNLSSDTIMWSNKKRADRLTRKMWNKSWADVQESLHRIFAEVAEESAREVRDQFRCELRSVLLTPAGGGQYRDVVVVEGQRVEHSCCQAVGLRWQFFRQRYRAAFGELPNWVIAEHPFHRGSLCDIALRRGLPLPNARPILLEHTCIYAGGLAW